MSDTFDFVIVGAGSAGCAMAYRLSEDGKNSVCVLEYGGSDRGPFIQMPSALSYPMNMNLYNWGFESDPEPGLGGRRLATSQSPREIAKLWLAARGRGGRYRPPPATYVQVPPAFGGRTVVDTALLQVAHACGWGVHVWTIDDPDEMVRLLDLGVDGIMTDRPTVLRQVLTERRAWPE